MPLDMAKFPISDCYGTGVFVQRLIAVTGRTTATSVAKRSRYKNVIFLRGNVAIGLGVSADLTGGNAIA